MLKSSGLNSWGLAEGQLKDTTSSTQMEAVLRGVAADAERAREALSTLLLPDDSGHLAGLLDISAQLRIAVENPITFRKALFWQDGEPVIWPRTVNMIQGQTGVHKSRVAELFTAAVLPDGSEPRQGDSLGIEFRPAEGEKYRVLYIDTERNLSDQLPYAIQGIKRRAGYPMKEHPEALVYTSLVMLPREKRFAGLQEFLAAQRLDFDGHLIVVLDVLSDCVGDFNDVKASLELMDSLNVAVNEENATFLAVLHENPGTGTANKARGHLGTEASNKASTVLQVSFVKEGGKPSELIQLLYLKRRFGAQGFVRFAEYDSLAKGLIRATPDLVEALTTAKPTGAKRKASSAEVLKVLPWILAKGPLSASVLENQLAEWLGVTDRTVRGYLTELLEPGKGWVRNEERIPCNLVKEKAPTGNTVLYSLQPVPGAIPLPLSADERASIDASLAMLGEPSLPPAPVQLSLLGENMASLPPSAPPAPAASI